MGLLHQDDSRRNPAWEQMTLRNTSGYLRVPRANVKVATLKPCTGRVVSELILERLAKVTVPGHPADQGQPLS